MGELGGTVEDVVNIWQGRRVLVTGHSGFKGGWLSHWFQRVALGSEDTRSTQPNMFTTASVKTVVDDVRGDTRDYAQVEAAVSEFAPEVFHLAAQPIVMSC